MSFLNLYSPLHFNLQFQQKLLFYMSSEVRKTNNVVSEHARHKPSWWLEAGNLEELHYPCCENKCADHGYQAKQICAIVFAYAKCWCSHDAAHIVCILLRENLPICEQVPYQSDQIIPSCMPVGVIYKRELWYDIMLDCTSLSNKDHLYFNPNYHAHTSSSLDFIKLSIVM